MVGRRCDGSGVVVPGLCALGRIFVGGIDPINPRVETGEEVKDCVLEAAEHIEPCRLGTCDDCGFAPCDDTSTTRETAFGKIQARVAGTQLAAQELRL